jgi:hypothetical protein
MPEAPAGRGLPGFSAGQRSDAAALWRGGEELGVERLVESGVLVQAGHGGHHAERKVNARSHPDGRWPKTGAQVSKQSDPLGQVTTPSGLRRGQEAGPGEEAPWERPR